VGSRVRLTSGMPVLSGTITSGFGMRRHPLLGTSLPHAGVDLAARVGSPVVATGDGTVSTAAWAGGYGLLVAVEHGRGRQTRYAHLSRLNVAAGQRVRQGDVIGFVGSTGRSTGPHLHYETRVNGRPINPRQ
jgi:murein DD-endopeptidase MepM/ murein hydrolase activator NlpD